MLIKEVTSFLQGLSLEDLMYIVESSLQYTDALENMVAYPNDYMSFKDLYAEPLDAVRATFYGCYRYTDDYIVINAVGNIDSYDSLGLQYFYNSCMEEIAEVVIEYDLLTGEW